MELAKQPASTVPEWRFIVVWFSNLPFAFEMVLESPTPPSEEDFVQESLRRLEKDDVNRLTRLIAYFETVEILPKNSPIPWIPPRDGRFYFDEKGNEDSKRWANLKKAHIESRSSSRSHSRNCSHSHHHS
jgi:hypothetical protein